jgi:hypothetical protein
LRTARRLRLWTPTFPTVFLPFLCSLNIQTLIDRIGVHVDSKGNVYAGVGDGVHVWSPSGTLLGKIYTGRTAANFQFVGGGRMVIGGETQLFYVTLAAQGSFVEKYL